MYDLGSALPTDHDVTVPRGTSVLITGPPMVGKSRLAMDVLIDGYRRGEGALVITTEQRAERVRSQFADEIPEFEESRLGIVECRSREGGTSGTDTPLVKYLSSPADLTGIGIGVTECMSVLNAVGTEENRMALASLSTMLSYTDRETVFKFCHVLTARAESVGYLGLFTLDANAHDQQTVNMIQRAFDVGIEIREADDGQRELRLVGLGEGTTDWRPI
jgi:KaiC/GvpD/RAD55 family RecA-like ATPase